MIVAYLLLAHAGPAQIARLARALPATSPLFVHIDRRASNETFRAIEAALADRPLTTFVERHACYWGAIGIVRGTMALIDAAVASGIPFDYATLLSAADYPIKSNAAIAATLAAADGAEFIESFRMDEPNRWTDHGGHYRAPDKVLRYHLRIHSRLIRWPWRRRLPDGLIAHGGGQWWTLSRQALDFITDYVRTHPAIMRFMKGVFIPDESFVQIVLSASPFHARVTGDPLRLVVWDRPTPPYPAVLKSADIELLANSPALFARKFNDEVDGEVYGLIDERLRRTA